MEKLLKQRESNGICVNCQACGNPVKRMRWELKPGKSVFCSRPCSRKAVGVAISTRYSSSFENRFWERVDKNGPVVRAELGQCWIWTGGKNAAGYGLVVCEHRAHLAHRMSFELTTGEKLEDLCALHKCDNPPCVRPDHLFKGSRNDNTQDMLNKGRHRVKRWTETHPNAKLTSGQIAEIQKLYAAGITQIELADRFCTSQSNISRIVRKEAWLWMR
jgi:hypothetical protein